MVETPEPEARGITLEKFFRYYLGCQEKVEKELEELRKLVGERSGRSATGGKSEPGVEVGAETRQQHLSPVSKKATIVNPSTPQRKPPAVRWKTPQPSSTPTRESQPTASKRKPSLLSTTNTVKKLRFSTPPDAEKTRRTPKFETPKKPGSTERTTVPRVCYSQAARQRPAWMRGARVSLGSPTRGYTGGGKIAASPLRKSGINGKKMQLFFPGGGGVSCPVLGIDPGIYASPLGSPTAFGTEILDSSPVLENVTFRRQSDRIGGGWTVQRLLSGEPEDVMGDKGGNDNRSASGSEGDGGSWDLGSRDSSDSESENGDDETGEEEENQEAGEDDDDDDETGNKDGGPVQKNEDETEGENGDKMNEGAQDSDNKSRDELEGGGDGEEPQGGDTDDEDGQSGKEDKRFDPPYIASSDREGGEEEDANDYSIEGLSEDEKSDDNIRVLNSGAVTVTLSPISEERTPPNEQFNVFRDRVESSVLATPHEDDPRCSPTKKLIPAESQQPLIPLNPLDSFVLLPPPPHRRHQCQHRWRLPQIINITSSPTITMAPPSPSPSPSPSRRRSSRLPPSPGPPPNYPLPPLPLLPPRPPRPTPPTGWTAPLASQSLTPSTATNSMKRRGAPMKQPASGC